jgi:hypothetical protein
MSEDPIDLDRIQLPPGATSERRVEWRSPKPSRSPTKRFAYLPLENDWGLHVLSIAGDGAAIVAYALWRQLTYKEVDIPITANVARRCGISRRVRTSALDRLEKGGVATVRRRGKFRGCPLLTLHLDRQPTWSPNDQDMCA